MPHDSASVFTSSSNNMLKSDLCRGKQKMEGETK